MNLKILYITLGILSTELLAAQNQTMEMSLEQVVKIARLESPDARTARHSFRSAYWNYKYYRANYLPSLSLSSVEYRSDFEPVAEYSLDRRFSFSRNICATHGLVQRT